MKIYVSTEIFFPLFKLCGEGRWEHIPPPPPSSEIPASADPLPVLGGSIWCCQLSSPSQLGTAVTRRHGGTKTKDVTNLSFSLL